MEASFLLGVNQKEFLFVSGVQTSALSWNAVWWDRCLNILSKAIQYPGASPVDRKRTSRINNICKQLMFKYAHHIKYRALVEQYTVIYYTS